LLEHAQAKQLILGKREHDAAAFALLRYRLLEDDDVGEARGKALVFIASMQTLNGT
jgi:hypothetical protein